MWHLLFLHIKDEGGSHMLYMSQGKEKSSVGLSISNPATWTDYR